MANEKRWPAERPWLWIESQGLPSFDLAGPIFGGTGLGLAGRHSGGAESTGGCPTSEGPETLAMASAAGFRWFTSVEDFKHYVSSEILAEELIA